MTLEIATPPYQIGPQHLARLEGWGMAVHAYCYLYKPRNEDEIRDVFRLARETGRYVAFRGGGRSYGDASILHEGLVIDFSRMNRILNWNKKTGSITAQPGVTLQQVWQHTITDGYWPHVVSGTMYTTLGGCASMNIHGKNNFKAGPFGNHITEFDLLLPSGEIVTCSRKKNKDLFFAAISGFGMLGCFTSITMKLKKVYSGRIRVEAFDTHNLQEMVEQFEERVAVSDYLVGWVDCLARGNALGRGIVHQAFYLEEGEDPRPQDHLNVAAQELPTSILGIFPKSMTHFFLSPFVNNIGMRAINMGKFWSNKLQPRGHCYYQSHGAFAFLLDYVPNWKLAYKPGGLIQYQSFIPKENAVRAYEKMLRLSQEAGLPPYLGVFKKHQPDEFLLTHALDGYSLALDYRVTPRNRSRVWDLAARLDDVVLENEGRFYFAKDATLSEHAMRTFFGEETINRFLELKRRCDPEGLLQTDLFRRLFGTYERE